VLSALSCWQCRAECRSSPSAIADRESENQWLTNGQRHAVANGCQTKYSRSQNSEQRSTRRCRRSARVAASTGLTRRPNSAPDARHIRSTNANRLRQCINGICPRPAAWRSPPLAPGLCRSRGPLLLPVHRCAGRIARCPPPPAVSLATLLAGGLVVSREWPRARFRVIPCGAGSLRRTHRGSFARIAGPSDLTLSEKRLCRQRR
jgi:hypothetical protein